eukprot:gb/GECG01007744.1/.p1 GENE.gb/GECG01007744.1/~~gb/GECG01007744.1/.p1  ORF type:complete len:112 (+),score=8.80 gb/GECG01007744.1/:1-336(+)
MGLPTATKIMLFIVVSLGFLSCLGEAENLVYETNIPHKKPQHLGAYLEMFLAEEETQIEWSDLKNCSLFLGEVTSSGWKQETNSSLRRITYFFGLEINKSMFLTSLCSNFG